MSNNGMLVMFVGSCLKDRSWCHGFEHAQDVFNMAKHIAKQEGVSPDNDLLFAICMCHDVWDHKFDTEQKNKADFVEYSKSAFGFSPEQIELIISEIDLISWSKGKTPLTLEGKLAQDADRIMGVGLKGVFRSAVYTLNTVPDIDPIWRMQKHFEEKISKIDQGMNFDFSKILCKMRIETFRYFLTNYQAEQKMFG